MSLFNSALRIKFLWYFTRSDHHTVQWVLLSVVFLVSHILVSIGITTAEEYCYNTGNFTTNSTYAKNRILILSSLASNVTANDGFYINATTGQDPNKVYAAAICRRDTTSPTDCSSCVNSTSQDLISNCPVQNEAISWGGTCGVRYAKRSFFGVVELNPVVPLCNVGEFPWNTGEFYQMWSSLMVQVARKTSMGSSSLKYATGEANLTHSDSIYALMQCTPDLSQSDCDYCLRQNVAQFETSCPGLRGGSILRPSCYLRWDMYDFSTPTPDAPLPIKEGKGGRKAKWIAIGASVLLAIVGTALFGYMWRRKNVKKEEKESSPEVQQLDLEGGKIGDGYSDENFQGEKPVKSQELLLIRLDIILAATKHFSEDNKLGEGGFGPVYKGVLADGKEIAVKRLSRTSGQGLLELKNEVILIARLQHRNLVRLLGCCLEGNEKLLIYEYMPNKSLDVFLFDSSMSVQLDWKRRLSIINGIARGILYLHEDSRLRVIHRDLKASNVLLDHEMNPKISDFGMARIFGGNQSEANTNRVVGTYGYMAPEYAMEGLFSVKSDVFSFGVLLLEIVSGKMNNRFYVFKHGQSLLNFAWKLWGEGQGLELIDPVIVQSCDAAEVLRCIHIGLLCVQEDPADRPTMSFVVVMLGSNTVTLPQPTQPAFSVGRFVASPAESLTNINFRSFNEFTLSDVSAR